MGFDSDKVPKLYQTDPSGVYSAWKANSIGRSSKTVREFLEKNYKEDMSKQETIKLAIKSLLEVVQTGAKNIEIAIMGSDSIIQVLCSILVVTMNLSETHLFELHMLISLFLFDRLYSAWSCLRLRLLWQRLRPRTRRRRRRQSPCRPSSRFLVFSRHKYGLTAQTKNGPC